MNVSQWFQERQGQSLLVPGADPSDRGQCAQAADYALKEIYGLSYVWANAIDWWGLPQSLAGNFTQITDGSIKAGDFVIYNQKIGSVYGHVDVALQDGNVNNFVAADSNWAGNLTLRQVSHINQSGYIIGVLRQKGTVMQSQDVINLFSKLTGESAPQDLINRVTAQKGLDSFYAFVSDPVIQAYIKDLQNWKNHAIKDLEPQITSLEEQVKTQGVAKDSVITYIQGHLS